MESLDRSREEAEVDWPRLQWALVVSQDCDLEFDFRARTKLREIGDPPAHGQERRDWNEASIKAQAKVMTMIILCQADVSDAVMAASNLTGAERRWAKSNQHERFHHLQSIPPDVDLSGTGVPELMLDFKRFIAVPAGELMARVALGPESDRRAERRAVLVSPYKEEVLVRYHNYHGRVAVPDAMPTSE
ncbi:hypothetical protein [Microbacterium sp.]|uniref:hypothetical protein n=1 Tax=Microbacterium sp. TaxID=51671 RepID=UPI0031FE8001|nr:hypothetical protein [Microbacterium sp.]